MGRKQACLHSVSAKTNKIFHLHSREEQKAKIDESKEQSIMQENETKEGTMDVRSQSIVIVHIRRHHFSTAYAFEVRMAAASAETTCGGSSYIASSGSFRELIVLVWVSRRLAWALFLRIVVE